MKRLSLYAVAIVVLGLIGVRLYAMDSSNQSSNQSSKYAPEDSSLAVATFAGGCFWCVESSFEQVPGVVEVVSGFSGGKEVNPSYQEVSSGKTSHTEAVQVYYDPSKITYEGLLQNLWRTMDPTDANGQFVDRGQQYRPAIFYMNDEQQKAAEKSKAELSKSGHYDKPVIIEVAPFTAFYPAEDYHQDYYKKNPVRYKFYTFNSGRYQFVDKIWGEGHKLDYTAYQPASDSDSKSNTTSKETQSMNDAKGFDAQSFVKPDDQALQQKLTPLQYSVTQEDGTERPFDNPMNDEKRAGIYVDIVSGEPLYSSTDKFDSGTGWPSFTKPIKADAVVEKSDFSLFGKRTEIRSAVADSHLGHVFADGPKPTGLRYCMNSAAMRFIPKEQMAAEGYAAYVDQVESVGKSQLRSKQ